jgi:hypothetical protein
MARLFDLPAPPETLGAMAGRLRRRVCRSPAVGVLLKPRPESPESDCVWVRYPPGAAPRRYPAVIAGINGGSGTSSRFPIEAGFGLMTGGFWQTFTD